MLDLRIDTFLEVCRCLNYTKAAERIHITQPAVSQHMRFLEEYYKTKLFKYEGKKLSLTKDGELLYRMAAAQKHDDDYLKERFAAAKSEQKELHFGVTLTIGEFVIAKPLSKLLAKSPDLSVHIITENTKVLLEKIRQGEIEFAIMEGNFPKKEYDFAVYSEEKFIPVCSSDYSFAGEVKKTEDLLGERLIIREEGSGTREVLLKDLERRNISLDDFGNVIEIGNMSAIKSLVSYGCGISFLYEAAVREELQAGTLRQIMVEDFRISHDFSFVWLKGSLFKEEYQKIFDTFNFFK